MGIIELFSDLMDSLFRLLFVVYVLILISMIFFGIGYFVSEMAFLIIGFIIYKARSDNSGDWDGFKMQWMCATLGCVLFFAFGSLGLVLAPIGRILWMLFW